MVIIGTLVKIYISEFDYTNHYVSLYKNENLFNMIHKEQNCSKEIVTGPPDVDLHSCYSKVEIEYGITEGLIIVIVLDKKVLNNLTTYYSFYNPKTGFN